jgi:hypothetical protein
MYHKFNISHIPKVTSNPVMSADPRNQAVIGMSDGIPMFKDKCARSVTPGALRTANLPDHLSTKFKFIHLAFLYPNEFWKIAEESGGARFERVPKKPATLSPLIHLLVDDLLFWEDGRNVIDYSLELGDPRRTFRLHTVLLFWTGDYPGLGEATGFAHQGINACHWCKIKGKWTKALHRGEYGGYVRYGPRGRIHVCTHVITHVPHVVT